MNRQEKNVQTREKIMEGARKEFALHGYEAGSLNTICQQGGVSKGIIYHYFGSKDALYLACVRECFERLTDHLTSELGKAPRAQTDPLTLYFNVRSGFFTENPIYSRLFAGAVMMPPQSLKAEIAEIRKPFDAFNAQYLREMIGAFPLREDLTVAEIIESLRLFQDHLNIRAHTGESGSIDMETHERLCKNALGIFLYGILRRE